MTVLDLCQTCQKPHPWSDGTMPRHPFNNGSLSGVSRLVQPKVKVTKNVSPWPFDPVLRQALIDAEVITPQQLRDAEEKIRAVTNTVEREVKDEQG